MTDQLMMLWPRERMAAWPSWDVPAGYLARHFRQLDADGYIQLMQRAGFESWNEDNLNTVLTNAVTDGIIMVEHEASARVVATAMGWCKPTALLPDAYEMGWVATDPTHRGNGLGRVVSAAATRALLAYGAMRIYLLTDDWRLPAIRIYLDIGYVPVYHQPNMRERWQQVLTILGLRPKDHPGIELPA